MAELLAAGLDGVKARGKANLGDKTMVDALQPAVRASTRLMTLLRLGKRRRCQRVPAPNPRADWLLNKGAPSSWASAPSASKTRARRPSL